MKFSIIVPVYNSRKYIEKVLRGCLNIEYHNKEIIVVDDGSTDGSADVASRLGVKVIRQENGGPAKARNTGWKASTGDICWFTDSDCIPQIDVLTVLAPHFSKWDVAAVGGSYLIANPGSLLARLIHAEIKDRHETMSEFVDFLGSFNLAVRKKTLEEVGGFNEEYTTPSGEDNDLSYRIAKTGKKLAFDISAGVAHFHETSLTRYLRQQYNHGKWRVKLYKEHKDKKGGDAYGGLFDFVQPVVGILLIPSLLLLPFEATREGFFYLLGFYGVLQLPRPAAVTVHTGRPENILLAVVTFFRGIARGLGLAAGVMRFGL